MTPKSACGSHVKDFDVPLLGFGEGAGTGSVREEEAAYIPDLRPADIRITDSESQLEPQRFFFPLNAFYY